MNLECRIETRAKVEKEEGRKAEFIMENGELTLTNSNCDRRLARIYADMRLLWTVCVLRWQRRLSLSAFSPQRFVLQRLLDSLLDLPPAEASIVT